MTFLAGLNPILLAAGLTVPPLVALYFLKLRRVAMPVSSTLLWRRAVEDLQVNAPFQRIRNNLLLWLQLLVLLLAALALGQPMMEAEKSDEDTVIVLIDQSASMGVEEPGGKTRLEAAKEQAKLVIDNMPDAARAMVIGFSDRATVACSFDDDKNAVKRLIDALEPTDSITTLSEAMTLAEAYTQNPVIPGEEDGAGVAIASVVSPARVVILTDGNIADAATLAVKRLPAEAVDVIAIGERSDNVAILSMDAKRNYERPQALEVFALVRNFGPEPVTLDANLYINDEHVDVQTMTLQPGHRVDAPSADDNGGDVESASDPAAGDSGKALGVAAVGSVASVAFDEIDYEGGGSVEVRLRVDDALACDNHARVVIQPPRDIAVLFVSTGDVFLGRLLEALPITVKQMTPSEYEQADDDALAVLGRSAYDVIILENHSTDRLAPGNYIFLGGVPLIEGVAAGELIDNEVIFNWDEAHPILRYVVMETVQVFQWLRLTLPPQAEVLIEGETSPLLALLSRDGRQYLISAFGFIALDEVTGEPMLNTDWVVRDHFPIFVSNALQYLAGSLSPSGVRNVQPGEAIEFPVPDNTDELNIRRPDGTTDTVPTGGFVAVNYANTRRVGMYEAIPAVEGRNRFAVNLFSAAESDIAPTQKLSLGGSEVEAGAAVRRVNRPVWPWLLLAMVVVLTLEWAIYSKRVYV